MLLILSLCFTSFPPFIYSPGWGSIPLCWEPISHAVAEFRGPQLGVSSVRMRDGRKVLSVLLGAGGGCSCPSELRPRSGCAGYALQHPTEHLEIHLSPEEKGRKQVR